MKNDPLIDPDALPPEFIELIRGAVELYRRTPRFKRRVRIGAMDFGVQVSRLDGRVRMSELKELFAHYTELAAASARANRLQAADLKAQEARDLEQARSEFLGSLTPGERVRWAEEIAARADAEARVACEYGQLLVETKRLGEQANRLTAEKAALRAEIVELCAAQLAPVLKERERANHAIAAAEQLVTVLAGEKGTLQRGVDQLSAEKRNLQSEVAELQARAQAQADHEAAYLDAAKKILADDEALLAEVQSLTARLRTSESRAARLSSRLANLDQAEVRLHEECRRWRGRAGEEARAAAKFKRERNALQSQVVSLTAACDELTNINAWLQQKLRFREKHLLSPSSPTNQLSSRGAVA